MNDLFMQVMSISFEVGGWLYIGGLWFVSAGYAVYRKSWKALLLNNLALLHAIFWILLVMGYIG